VQGCVVEHLLPVLMNLEAIGCQIEVGKTTAVVTGPEKILPIDIKTMPYPGFATDMQQPFGALCALADGTSTITETVYESRFKYTNELVRMGADILVEGRTAIFRGVPRLTGAQVQANDLRSGAAMVLAGLAAQGETQISELQYLDRGYEDMVGKLKGLGAVISRSGTSIMSPLRDFTGSRT
ncbi:MAG: UDP-N-acetylglucosamine 1-carboxyvinyltransferase, partial [Chloroflexi bacterium]|nr:UDP-N-acetylglucosamine 1-carboxyvinyltransferase [Chloroflexota bacterium]